MPTSNGGTLFGGTAAEPETGAVYVIAHDNPGILRLLRPGEGPRRRCRRDRQGNRCISSIASSVMAPTVSASATVPALVHAAADPARNIAAGAPRSTRRASAPILATGKGRMSAFPHLTAAEVDNLVTFLATPGGRGRGAGGWRRTRRRAAVRDRAHRPS